MSNEVNLSCPIPFSDYATVQMAHGGGGRMMRNLIEGMFLPAFRTTELPSSHSPLLSPLSSPVSLPHDSAVLPTDGARLAFTTDSYVVNPLFFPGGDIGKLAVYGTVNDLAMAGARPAYLSAGFILEEGLPMETLRPRGRFDGRGRPDGRRADRHRRYQGGRSRQGRRHVYQHRGRGLGPAGHRHFARPSCSPATRSCSAAISAATAWRSCRSARGFNSRARWKAIVRRWPNWSRRCSPRAPTSTASAT